MPLGRHLVSGNPVGFFLRWWTIATASGRSGRSAGLTSQKMLLTYFVISPRSTWMFDGSVPRARIYSLTAVRSACQTPDKFGLPFTRGAGADKFGLPSLVRGVRESG